MVRQGVRPAVAIGCIAGAAARGVVFAPSFELEEALDFDDAELRYSRGNDLAQEFLFPYREHGGAKRVKPGKRKRPGRARRPGKAADPGSLGSMQAPDPSNLLIHKELVEIRNRLRTTMYREWGA